MHIQEIRTLDNGDSAWHHILEHVNMVYPEMPSVITMSMLIIYLVTLM